MATITNITTGEQSVSATGAVTGSLDTSALSGDYTVKLRVRGLLAGKRAVVAVEDTANVTPYSDKVQVAVKHFVGGDELASGTSQEWRSYDIPSTRFGATNTALRVTVLSITGSPTFSVFAWLEQ